MWSPTSTCRFVHWVVAAIPPTVGVLRGRRGRPTGAVEAANSTALARYTGPALPRATCTPTSSPCTRSARRRVSPRARTPARHRRDHHLTTHDRHHDRPLRPLTLVIVLVVAALVVVVVILCVVVAYNRFVRQRQFIDNAWANVETELRRRYDLVPNLVADGEGLRRDTNGPPSRRSPRPAPRPWPRTARRPSRPVRGACSSGRCAGCWRSPRPTPTSRPAPAFLDLQRQLIDHRGPHPGGTALLQQQRAGLQRPGAVGPHQRGRQAVRLPRTHVLQRRRGSARRGRTRGGVRGRRRLTVTTIAARQGARSATIADATPSGVRTVPLCRTTTTRWVPHRSNRVRAAGRRS